MLFFWCQKETSDTTEKKKQNKGYQINRNIALGTLKSYFTAIFTCKNSDLTSLIDKLKIVYLNNLELVCDKNPPRGANKLGKRERNSTERNYKRAI